MSAANTSTDARAELLAALRAEADAADRVQEWLNMMDDPAGHVLSSGSSYSWDTLAGGGVRVSSGGVTVEFGPPKVTWKGGAPPPRPPGPDKMDPHKTRVMFALMNEDRNASNTDARSPLSLSQQASALLEKMMAESD